MFALKKFAIAVYVKEVRYCSKVAEYLFIFDRM